jgi:peptidoglycan/xylan/chitin deacetylase (PgdA/CDA1 family)
VFRSRSVILMYHRVVDVKRDRWALCVTPEHFAQHLDVLRKHQRTRLDRLTAGGWSLRPKVTVAITFDDGYADNFHNAAPLLKKYETPASFFITTGYIGGVREFWWDELERIVPENEYLSRYEALRPLIDEVRQGILNRMSRDSQKGTECRPSHRPMSVDELCLLASDDLFEVGAHTVTHPLLSAQPLERQQAEITGSKNWLQHLLERPVTSFSYPYGGGQHYSPATVQIVRNAGFSRACTTVPRPVTWSDDHCQLGRLCVPDVDGDAFEKILHT